MVSPRWSRAPRERWMTVRTRGLMIGKRISGALAPARHGSQDLRSAFVAAVHALSRRGGRADNVTLSAFYDGKQFLVLRLGHIEFRHRVVEILAEGGPLILGDLEMFVGLKHGTAHIVLKIYWPHHRAYLPALAGRCVLR